MNPDTSAESRKDRWDLVRKSKVARVGMIVGALMLVGFTIMAAMPSFSIGTKGAARKPAAEQESGIRPDLASAAEMRSLTLLVGEESKMRSDQMKQLMEDSARTRGSVETIAGRLERLEVQGAERRTGPPPEEFLRAPAIRIEECESKSAKEKKEAQSDKRVAIPAGSYGRGTLLTGVYAPTSGASLPVVLRLNEVLVGPNRSRIPIQGALLVGRATGDPNSERAQIEVTTVAFVDAEGHAHEIGTSGFAVADDGYLGIKGEYVWRVAETLWPAMVASGLSGAANIFQIKSRRVHVGTLGNQTIDFKGDEFAAAGFGAIGAAADTLSEALKQRVNEITPAIAVANGADVTIAFQTGFEIPIDPKLLGAAGRTDHADVDSSVIRGR